MYAKVVHTVMCDVCARAYVFLCVCVCVCVCVWGGGGVCVCVYSFVCVCSYVYILFVRERMYYSCIGACIIILGKMITYFYYYQWSMLIYYQILFKYYINISPRSH